MVMAVDIREDIMVLGGRNQDTRNFIREGKKSKEKKAERKQTLENIYLERFITESTWLRDFGTRFSWRIVINQERNHVIPQR